MLDRLLFEGPKAVRKRSAFWVLAALAAVIGEGFLASALAWTAGVAVLFGLLEYLYYAVSVVIGMGAVGFTLGTTAMVALGASWSWLVAPGTSSQ